MRSRPPGALLRDMEIPDNRSPAEDGPGAVRSAAPTRSPTPASPEVTLARALLILQSAVGLLVTLLMAYFINSPLCLAGCEDLSQSSQSEEAALVLLAGGTVCGLLLVGGAWLHDQRAFWWAAVVGVGGLAGAILFLAGGQPNFLLWLLVPGLDLVMLLSPTIRHAAPS